MECMNNHILSLLDRIVITDTNNKVRPPIWICREILDNALVNKRVRDLYMVSVKRKQNRGSHVEVLHDTLMLTDPYPVTCAERVSNAEKNTGKRVCSNLSECEAQYDADESGAAQDGNSQPCKTCDLKHDIKTDQENGYRQGRAAS